MIAGFADNGRSLLLVTAGSVNKKKTAIGPSRAHLKAMCVAGVATNFREAYRLSEVRLHVGQGASLPNERPTERSR